MRGAGDPVLYVQNPAGVDAIDRRNMLDALNQVNERTFARCGDPVDVHGGIAAGEFQVFRYAPLADRGGAFERASADLRFASAVAAFGMILRGSEGKGAATLPLVAKIAAGALGPDNGGYRAEFLDLVRKAEALGAR